VIVVLAVLGVTVSVALAQESVIVGTDGDDVVTGTPVDDSLYGRSGNDALLGLAGEDELDGGSGADGISGGPGDDDSVSYTGASANVTLDGQANDGAPGEGDNVLPDVENVYGTDGPDVITGSAAANTIDGNAGDDRIDGGPGSDSLIGGEGDDTIDSRDGSADSVDCGPGHDSALYDANDILRDCEALGRTPVTENFQLNRPPAGASRLRTLRLVNIARGSKITVACVSRCRPRSPRTRAVAHRRSVAPAGLTRVVRVRIKRSPLAAGATFEIGVKAPRSKARCRRWLIVRQSGRIGGVRALSAHCRTVARDG
jgi:Ca2+-binding RTX toxin-like protein